MNKVSTSNCCYAYSLHVLCVPWFLPFIPEGWRGIAIAHVDLFVCPSVLSVHLFVSMSLSTQKLRKTIFKSFWKLAGIFFRYKIQTPSILCIAALIRYVNDGPISDFNICIPEVIFLVHYSFRTFFHGVGVVLASIWGGNSSPFGGEWALTSNIFSILVQYTDLGSQGAFWHWASCLFLT